MKRIKAILTVIFSKRYFVATIKKDNWYVQNTFPDKDLTKSGNAIYFH